VLSNWRWSSRALLRALAPATVKPGVWKGLFGIWKRALEPPAMKLTRVCSSMMPVILARPCHWSVSSWIGEADEVGFSMPMLLCRNWPVAK
jgi:hypothetical protein